MQKYIKVKWLHESNINPTMIYSELDENSWETRKIELYKKNPPGYASEIEEVRGSGLSEVPMSSIEKIATNPAFIPSEISKEEFEALWMRVTSGEIVYASG